MKKAISIWCLALLAIVAWSDRVTAESDRSITGLWIFGDSLSDTGNLSFLTFGFEPPSPPYYDGRFSNGPLWVEGLAQRLGLAVDFDTPSAIDPLANNQAIGGAFTDTRGEALADTGVLSQVDGFLAAGGVIGEDDLVVIWAGANNYFGGDFDPLGPVADLANAVEELAIGAGARRFMLLNMPNLGDTPAGQASGAAQALNALAAGHNAALAVVAADLAALLDLDVVIIDIKTGFAALLEDPQIYGFDNVTTPCLIQQSDGSRFPSGACPAEGDSFDAAGTVFWDLIHPTAAANALLAQFAYSALVAEQRLPTVIADRQMVVNHLALGQVRAYANSQAKTKVALLGE